MRTWKKALSLLLSLSMLLSLCVVGASAEEGQNGENTQPAAAGSTAVAMVDSTEYYSLATALKAVPDEGTVVLCKSTEEAVDLRGDDYKKSFTIDATENRYTYAVAGAYEGTDKTFLNDATTGTNLYHDAEGKVPSHLSSTSGTQVTYSHVAAYLSNSVDSAAYLCTSMESACAKASTAYKYLRLNEDSKSQLTISYSNQIIVIPNGYSAPEMITCDKTDYVYETVKTVNDDGSISFTFSSYHFIVTTGSETAKFGSKEFADAIAKANEATSATTLVYYGSQTIAASNAIVLDSDITLSIQPSKKLTIKGSLTVNGTLDNKGTIDLKSGGSLTVPDGATVGTITVPKNNVLATSSNNGMTTYTASADAEGEVTLKIGSTAAKYGTLSDALIAAGGNSEAVITLEKDITAKAGQAIRNVTIDLNGHTLAAAEGSYLDIWGTTTTFKDSSAAKTGKVTGSGDLGLFVMKDDDSSSLTLESGVYEYTGASAAIMTYSRGADAASIQFTLGADATVSSKGYGLLIQSYESASVTNIAYANVQADISGKITADYAAVYINGKVQDAETALSKITVNDGAELTGYAVGIYAAGVGAWDIKGGTINGGIEAKGGTVDISGTAAINVTGTPTHTANGNGNSTTGYAVAVVDNAGYPGAAVTISGGTVNGAVALLDNDSDAANNKSTLSITGGTFSLDPSTYVAPGYLAVSEGDVFKVTKLAVNEIVSVAAAVKTADDKPSTEEASVDIVPNSLTVSGQITKGNTVVVTYICTDKKTGTITITNDEGVFTASPATVTVGTTTYTVNVSGLSILPVKVEVAAPEVPAPTVDSEAENPTEANAAATTIKDNTSSIAADGLSEAVVKEIVSTDETEESSVTVKTDNGSVVTKTAAEVVAEAQADRTVPTVSNASEADLVIVVQPVLNIEVKDVVEKEGSKVLELNISAQSQVVVTTSAIKTEEIKVGTNAVAVGQPMDVVVNTAITLTIPIPEGFVATGSENDVFVEHTMHNGNVETVKAVYDPNHHTITFTVNGMSPMNVITDARTCTINYNYDAGTTESLTYRADSATAIMPTDSRSGYTFNGWTLKDGEDTIGTYKAMTDELLTALNGKAVTATPSFTKNSTSSGSSSGGGGDSSTAATYSVTVSSVVNGTVKSNVTSAAKDAKVTLTVTPASGYTLDSLTVKDASGNTISVTKASAATYTFTMPASKVTVSATFKATDEIASLPFTDVVTDAYYYDAVKWAVDEGVTAGKTATTFAPNDTCTRAQTVTFLWRAMGSPEPTSAVNPFTDVSADAYYYRAVLWAVEKGITVGTSATTFAPDATVSRAQVATFLWRAAGTPAASTASTFTDVPADAYYAAAVIWAAEKGVTSGTSGTTFAPANDCTRAQIVTFLYRYLGK